MDLPKGSESYGEGEHCLVFLPGFMCTPAMYRALLRPVADAGARVVVPLPTRPGPKALLGRITPAEEADSLTALLTELRAAHGGLWLGGHSRGGFIAWLASAAVDLDGLLLVDPVGGGGPPWATPEPPPARSFRVPPLVIGLGAGDGTRCAPKGRNHHVFAAAAPGCRHEVIADAGHADVLDGWSERLGGLMCSAGSDPHAVRARVAELLVDAVRPG